MTLFQGARRNKSSWSSPAVAVVLVVGALLLASSAVRIVRREEDIRRQRQEFEKKRMMLEAENARLRALVDAARSPDAVERLAKAKLNLKKPGEEVVVVAPSSSSASGSPGQAGGRRQAWLEWLASFIDFFRR